MKSHKVFSRVRVHKIYSIFIFLWIKSTSEFVCADGEGIVANHTSEDNKYLKLTPLTKIINGKEAGRFDFPFFTRLRRTDNAVHCGGVLIASDIVLTAAHCDHPDLRVGINAYSSNPLEDTNELRRTIVNRKKHPQFNEKTLAYDFMLLRLNEPVYTVTPARITKNANNPGVGDVLRVIGLGTVQDDTIVLPGTLQYMDVRVLSLDYCNKENSYKGAVKDPVMFCAGFTEKHGVNRDSCFGDSGGPMIDSNGYLVGIISWGIGCAQINYPGVYARVGLVYDWVDREACALSEANSGGFLSCHSGRLPLPPQTDAFASNNKEASADFKTKERSKELKRRDRRRSRSKDRNQTRRRGDYLVQDCENNPHTEVKYSTAGLRNKNVQVGTCEQVGNDLNICAKYDTNSYGRKQVWQVCPRECSSLSGCSGK